VPSNELAKTAGFISITLRKAFERIHTLSQALSEQTKKRPIQDDHLQGLKKQRCD
jgi:hypothetical protein